MNAAGVRRSLAAQAKRYGSQRALAKAIGVSATFLNDIICGHREPSGKPITFLGLERKVTYTRKA